MSIRRRLSPLILPNHFYPYFRLFPTWFDQIVCQPIHDIRTICSMGINVPMWCTADNNQNVYDIQFVFERMRKKKNFIHTISSANVCIVLTTVVYSRKSFIASKCQTTEYRWLRTIRDARALRVSHNLNIYYVRLWYSKDRSFDSNV